MDVVIMHELRNLAETVLENIRNQMFRFDLVVTEKTENVSNVYGFEPK